MTEHYFFLLAVSFLIVHEMDAIRCKEWRIFPGLSLLSEKAGKIVFIFAHIPLLFILLYQLKYNSESNLFIKWFDIFMIIHVGLHLLFLKYKSNEFKDWISWILVLGAGIFGIADLL